MNEKERAALAKAWNSPGGQAARIAELERQLSELMAACETTLDENCHLADGDDCTLIALKRALESIKGDQR